MPPKRKSAAAKAKQTAKKRSLENKEKQTNRLSQNRLRIAALREQQTTPEREQENSQNRLRIAALREQQTTPEREQEKSQTRHRIAALREQQTTPEREQEKSQNRLIIAALREQQTTPEREQEKSQTRLRIAALREQQTTPEREQEKSQNRLIIAALREQQTTPEREQEKLQTRHRIAALREQQTTPEREQEKSQNRLIIAALREQQTTPEREQEKSQTRLRIAALREQQTTPEREQEKSQNRLIIAALREQQTTPEREQEKSQTRLRIAALREQQTTPERAQRRSQNRYNVATSRQQETTLIRSRRLSQERNRRHNVRREQHSQSLANEIRGGLNVTEPVINDPDRYTVFEKYQMSLKWNECSQCNEKALVHKTLTDPCNRCLKFSNKFNPFSKDNNMCPGEQPDELRELSFVEEQLIARVHPVVSVYRIQGQQYGYSGHVINFPQEVNELAKRLPHALSSLSSILIVRKESANHYVDFRVNRHRVQQALLFLKSNNIFYKDIEIDQDTLRLLPEDGNLFSNDNSILIAHLAEDTSEGNETENDIIITDAPNLTLPPEKAVQIKSILAGEAHEIPWPVISSEPINEFSTVGYVAMAFPTLFPTGAADLRSPRQVKVTPSDYFKHLLRYKDERFAKNPRFRFFAMNSTSRWASIQNGKICLQRNSDLADLTAAELKERFKSDPGLVRRLMCYNSTVRGTAAYWRARCGELLDMVQQLGPPTLFFTLSAADLHWPELYRILDPSTDYSKLNRSEAFKRRSNLLNNNPMIVNHFFHLRADFFIKEVMVPYFGVNDYWYRTEFQHRGSPHIHGVIWIANAPDVSRLDDADEETLLQIGQFFDRIVSTNNPQMNAQIPLVHPCQVHYSDINDHKEDCSNLINCCQRHTHHGIQCIRKNKTTGIEECRFKFPFPLQEQTCLLKENGQWQIVTQRNDPLINRHNRFVTENWRANTDVQCILSVDAVLNYIAKYASKAEPRSKAMEELLADALSKGEDSAKTAIQKLFIRMCSERDYSAQETFHIIMGQPLYHCSRAFVKVNVEPQQWIPFTDNPEEQDNVIINSVLDTYPHRPSELQQMPMIEFFSKYYRKGLRWITRRIPAIVRVFPKLKVDSIDKEAYYRQQVLLHVPWLNIGDFEGRSWQEHYNTSVKQPEPLQLPIVEDEYEEVTDEQLGDDEEWMVVAGAGPNGEIGPAVEIGCRDIDTNFDWSQSYNSYCEPLNLPSFILHKKKVETDEPVQWDVPKLNFSQEQQKIMELLKCQISTLKDESAERQPHMVIIQGKAGSGKSTVIKAICAYLCAELGHQSFRLLAPTGAAAVNVNGSTIHSGLSISIGNAHIELGAEQAQNFQEDMKNCHFIIIDEMSMLGCALLKKIDLRCRECKPSNADKPFGNMFVYLLGDIKQLPPVLDRPFYGSGFKGTLYDQGQILYKSIPVCFILNTSYRQQGADQQKFRELLDRLSIGESSVEDWQLLMTRERNRVPHQETTCFQECVRLYPTNMSVSTFNLQKLESLNQPTVKIPADNNNAEAAKADYEKAQGLEKTLYFCVGCRVMLKTNLWVKKGLVNGAMGTVTDIVYQPGRLPPNERPLAVCVKFDNYTGPSVNNSVPIAPVTRTWKSGSIACSRTQFPLILAWAVTIHKSQGLTLPKVVVDIGEKELAPGCTYVALSRVRKLSDIIFDPGFNLDRLTRIKHMKLLCQRVDEEIRLLSLSM